MALSALSDEQLNRKLAKLLGWKESVAAGKERAWWHDNVGDGPPMDYCKQIGRQTTEIITEALNTPSVPNVTKANPPTR